MVHSSIIFIYVLMIFLCYSIYICYCQKCRKVAKSSVRPVHNLGCEYQQICAEDVSRHCNHSSGKEGKCTLGGMCCPSFLL